MSLPDIQCCAFCGIIPPFYILGGYFYCCNCINDAITEMTEILQKVYDHWGNEIYLHNQITRYSDDGDDQYYEMGGIEFTIYNNVVVVIK